jgi:hypothetical protein
VLRGPLAIGTAGLWAVMALSADLFPLAMSYLVFYRCTDQRPTERSLPPGDWARARSPPSE